MIHRAAVVLLVLLLAGCTIGYRHTRHAGSINRSPGKLDIEGSGNTADLAITLDFRFLRASLPFEAGRRQLEFIAPNGRKDTLDLIRERRLYRLDVPVLSLWDFEERAFGGYPGLMRHRHSLELWVTGETDMRTENEWWVDLGLTYYRYAHVGFRIFFGAGALPFDAATPVMGTRFPTIWRGNAPTFGGGLSVIITTGEFGLDALLYLAGVDKTHRNRAKRQNPGF